MWRSHEAAREAVSAGRNQRTQPTSPPMLRSSEARFFGLRPKSEGGGVRRQKPTNPANKPPDAAKQRGALSTAERAQRSPERTRTVG